MNTDRRGSAPLRAAGFTLIELVIVVAIIAILTAIALPRYNDYITRGKLTDGQNYLANYRVSMEQFYQDSRNYGTAVGATTCGVTPTNSSYFTITCVTNNANQGFKATATGMAGTPVNGFIFTIDNTNTKQTTAVQSASWGPLPSNTSPCWIIRKGGGCT
jgi:type IV pilus assembly protein PilE